MQTAFVANGELDPALVGRIKSFSRIVAVDGGLVHCHRLGIAAHFLIGDFDSCPRSLLSNYPDLPYTDLPQEKDRTDLEAALQLELVVRNKNSWSNFGVKAPGLDDRKNFCYGPLDRASRLTIFGGCGGRIDHSLTNALLLTRYPGKVALETGKELLFGLGKETKVSCTPSQTLSLIPLNGPAIGITTKGLKWELANGKLDHHFVGISNVCLAHTVEIRYEKGSLLCCMQKETHNA